MALIKSLEANYTPIRVNTGPIYLSKHGLYDEISLSKNKYWTNWSLMNLLGQNKTMLQISEELNMDFGNYMKYLKIIKGAKVIKVKI